MLNSKVEATKGKVLWINVEILYVGPIMQLWVSWLEFFYVYGFFFWG